MKRLPPCVLAACLVGGGARADDGAVPPMNSVTARAPAVLSTHVVVRPPDLARAHPPAPAAHLTAAPADANLRLWLYDPRQGRALATGIFLRDVDANGAWTARAAHPDGSVYVHLSANTRYEFDVVEPGGQTALLRRRYQAAVDAAGVVRVARAPADAAGIVAVTLDVAPEPATPAVRAAQDALRALAARPAGDFVPASPCQLPDRVTPRRGFGADVAAGFPKVRVRLPSYGHVRALIVPVDFPDVRGTDDPGRFFTPLAEEVRDFYLKQSYGRLAFDFDILPDWVHLPFEPGDFGIGRANGSGDFAAYRAAVFALLDGQLDVARYDAVYLLVPRQMPMANMGYGPAITAPTWTRTGYVINGATGGADMYFNEDGRWRWMAHETGHAFGLVDEDLDHRTQTLGHWSLMAMSWSLHAIEHNAWDRYLQGWLTQAQVACLARPAAPMRVSLRPLVRQDGGVKAAMVPLGPSTILVAESRRNEGYDRIAAGHEGVLVYTVDTARGSLGGGYRTVRRPGSADPSFEDATLHPGDAVMVDGVKVTVDAAGPDGDTVTLSGG